MATLINRSTAGPAVETSIDYLVPTSKINRRFWAPGREVNTGVYQSYPVTIRNARLAPEPFTLDKHGFCLARHVSGVGDFRDPDAVADYPAEVAEVARMLTGCDLVVPMSGQLRSPVISGAGIQPPAAEAHVDFNTGTAHRIAKALHDKAASAASSPSACGAPFRRRPRIGRLLYARPAASATRTRSPTSKSTSTKSPRGMRFMRRSKARKKWRPPPFSITIRRIVGGISPT